MVFSNNLLMGAGGQATGYEIEQSIRFNDDDSAFMDRTPSSASNRKTWTWSGWVKRASNSEQAFFAAGANSSDRFGIRFSSAANGAYLGVFDDISAGTSLDLQSEKNFVDFAAWYHIVVAVDTTQSTASNRCKVYVNGNQITDFNNADYMGQNTDTSVNNNVNHRIGRLSYNTAQQFDGYLAEINFVDGSQLAPANFGETSNTTGQWVPIKYAGSYGTNGFYIKGEDSSDLGNDSSGNNNDFTTSGLAAADQVTDSPTDNHCVLNLLDGAGTLSDGNLVNAATGSGFVSRRATIGIPSSGKWAFRVKKSANNFMVGVMAPQATDGDPDTNGVDAVFYYDEDGTSSGDIQTRRSGSKVVETTDPPAGIAADTFMEVLIDKDNNRLGVVIGGTAYVAVDSGVAIQDTMTQIFVSTAGSGVTATVDFGQSGFTPSQAGYKALSTANLDDPAVPDPADQFDIGLWAGNNTDGRAITGYNFAPDWVWIKARNNDYSHSLTDAVRGAGVYLQSNTNDAEVTGPGAFGSTLAFTSDGFTLDNGTTSNLYVNQTGTNYVGWAWNANGSGSSNTDGSINSTVSANTTSGFSIVSYSGNATSGATVGHGLGADVKMIMLKDRGVTENWCVFHEAMGPTKFVFLNTADGSFTNSNRWNNTSPTSSVFTLGNETQVNGSGRNYIAYCFAEVDGFSRFGGYEGNGSTDGPFVYTGFKPRWIMFRRYDAGDGWSILDTARGSGNFGSEAGSTGKDPTAGNEMNNKINANDHFGEEDNSGGSRKCSFLSNGFKVKNTNTAMNASGGDYLYMAFAESPFKTATAR